MTDTTNESAPLLIYPRPTPSTPGAPVEGREDADDVLDAEDYAAAHADECVSVRIRALAAEVRRLRSALAEAQRDGERLDTLEALFKASSGLRIEPWCHDGRRFLPESADHMARLMVHHMADRGGRNETLRDALDAARSPREDATTSTTEG
jgi:hypothetical protein